MIINKNNTKYFKWLCNMVYCGEDNRYFKLANKLHNTPFIYLKTNLLLMRDSSREDDGLLLREDFINDKNKDITNIQGECSVFEMLIALSRRIDDICTISIDNKIHRWFWVLLSNLKLSMYDDFNYNEKEIDKILNIFMNRKYDKHCNGGLFPLKNYKGDMRKNDIAMQMHHYLNHHNYSFPKI